MLKADDLQLLRFFQYCTKFGKQRNSLHQNNYQGSLSRFKPKGYLKVIKYTSPFYEKTIIFPESQFAIGVANLSTTSNSTWATGCILKISSADQGCADGGAGDVMPPNIFKLARKFVKTQPYCKRVGNSSFRDLFFLVTTGRQLVKAPPQRKVSRHITAADDRNEAERFTEYSRHEVGNLWV